MISGIPVEYVKFLNRTIWLLDETITDNTTPGHSVPGSNGNEDVLHTPKALKFESNH